VIPDEAALLTETFRVHATFPSRGKSNAVVHETARLTWIDSGLETDTFNLVLGSRLDPGDVQPALAGVSAHFASVRRPFSWWVSPGDQPSDLEARLASGGLVAEEWGLAMACPIADIRQSPAGPALAIERVRDAASLGELARVNAENWTPPDPLIECYYGRAAESLLSENSPLRFFLGRRDGAAVAAVELAVAGPALGVYSLTTRPAHRGQGIGGSLLPPAVSSKRRRPPGGARCRGALPAAGLHRSRPNYGVQAHSQCPIRYIM
jgi:hypothetical protein